MQCVSSNVLADAPGRSQVNGRCCRPTFVGILRNIMLTSAFIGSEEVKCGPVVGDRAWRSWRPALVAYWGVLR